MIADPIKVRRIDFSPDEWLAGTTKLSVIEKGCYWTVCCLIYSKGGPVDDDPAWLARNCGCDVRRWRSARARLLALGKLILLQPEKRAANGTFAGGKLTNSRCEQELNKARTRTILSRSAAERSAISRRSRRDVRR